MTNADVSIIGLAVLLTLSLVPRAHLGLAAFPAAFIVAGITGVDADDFATFFPSGFFTLIVGVMALFAIIQMTGAMDAILSVARRLAGGKVVLLPVVAFAVGALLACIGTLPVAAIAIAAPLTMGMAKTYRLPQFLMAASMLNGILCGLFSPIAVFGLTSNAEIDKLGIDMPSFSNVALTLIPLAIGVALTAILMFVYRHRLRECAAQTSSVRVDADQDQRRGGRPAMIGALVALALLVIAGVGFDLNMGYVGFLLAFVLMMAFKLESRDIIDRVPWGAVVLICGLLTYLGLMEHLGAFKRLGELLTIGDSAVLGLLVLCYIAAITSFLANSIAVIVTVLPLLPPLIDAGVNPLGAVLAVLLSAVLVDLNPIGATGGLVLGATTADSRQRLFRQMLAWGLGAVAMAPVTMWALFGLW
ncbi:SLC13 family permease [Nocardioides sp. NBC_00163]|uniref:SLC13 family permease n=1 Tax=Nocardioides sp. NBC_00163 TaxID=2975999 RepID=UPI00324C470D